MRVNPDEADGEGDFNLVRKYLRGDVDALGRLVERYRRPLFSFILNMTGGAGDAEEVFQEVWHRAIRRLDAYSDRSMASWLMRIAHNLVIDRARARKPSFSLDEQDEDGLSGMDRLESRDPTPTQEMSNRELTGRIAGAVAMLPAEQKEVFLLRVQSQMPFKDIAKVQKTSVNTVLARMHYAMGRLRTLLKSDYEELLR